MRPGMLTFGALLSPTAILAYCYSSSAFQALNVFHYFANYNRSNTEQMFCFCFLCAFAPIFHFQTLQFLLMGAQKYFFSGLRVSYPSYITVYCDHTVAIKMALYPSRLRCRPNYFSIQIWPLPRGALPRSLSLLYSIKLSQIFIRSRNRANTEVTLVSLGVNVINTVHKNQ